MKYDIRVLLLSSFVCLVIFSSCKRHVIKENLYNMYQKEVIFPKGMAFVDGKKYSYNSKEKIDATIAFWFDSTVCSVCRFERMVQFGEIFDFCVDSISSSKTNIAIIFTPKSGDVDYLCEYVTSHVSDYPIFIDKDGIFGQFNKFIAKDENCHTFLLD